MPLEKLQIINEALTLARGKTIQSLEDTNSNSARVANNLYDSVVNDLFSRYPWSFALNKKVLNRTTNPVNEWRYAHVLPAEELRVWSVFSDRAGSLNRLPTNQYDKIAQGDTKVIVSNSENIIAEYVIRIEPSLWSAPFRKLVAYGLAADMALALTEDIGLQNTLQAIAYGTPSQKGKGGRFALAVQQDVQQKPPTRNASSPLTDARFGGYGGI